MSDIAREVTAQIAAALGEQVERIRVGHAHGSGSSYYRP